MIEVQNALLSMLAVYMFTWSITLEGDLYSGDGDTTGLASSVLLSPASATKRQGSEVNFLNRSIISFHTGSRNIYKSCRIIFVENSVTQFEFY